jgi:hypothetical protein
MTMAMWYEQACRMDLEGHRIGIEEAFKTLSVGTVRALAEEDSLARL